MRIKFVSAQLKQKGTIAVFVSAKGSLLSSATKLNEKTQGALKRATSNEGFSGAAGQALVINSPNGVNASKIVLVGIGEGKKLTISAAQAAGGKLWSLIEKSNDAVLIVDPVQGSALSVAEIAANMAYGVLLKSYRFDKYRTKEKRKDKPTLRTLSVGVRDPAEAKKVFDPLQKISNGVFFTRDLVSEPANILNPENFVTKCRALSKLGLKMQVLTETQMKKLGMGALLGVAQGSANSPRILAMKWNGAPQAREKRPIAFIGKGVTFDSGGISIKPAGGMEDMKWDMGGAGVVAGLMYALAARKAKVNAVGIVGLVENMPSGTAQRPGDVVTSMSGQTIEVINTDAEGRLVLADAMWWCQQKFNPHTMIDLATLTGAIIIALGYHHAGMFSNDDDLSLKLIDSGKSTGELLWRMPLAAEYDKQVKSQIADMKNVGGRDAGSITAAQILQRFIRGDVKWAHLDIAGVTWTNENKPIVPRGGTGFGVRLLDDLVARFYEKG
tara:strand:+ start:68 stop:1564 length:1497 start_codon:yes stop_codon:yes gene_type:complete